MARKFIGWLEHRTGIESGITHFLYEEIPASSGWRQVFGSVALFLFLLQAFTGILLALNYAPTPGDAYNSLRYIMAEMTGGRIIRNAHHWGASMMIVIIVVHMAQAFLWGAYKKPRETTWMVGVALLLLVLAYGLTGYLLPWDNRAYWGTVVTTQIAAKAPVLGPYFSRLMGAGEGSVGVVTFARFYALHVILLPPLTLLLIAIHVYLVRKHGVTPAPDDDQPKKKFYPEQVFKDTIAIFTAFIVLVFMAIWVHAPLERLADPTDNSYVPRPEWYFLFLFQTLKFFEGPLEVVGSAVLPGLAVLALLLTPFIDRGRLVKVAQRTTAAGILVLAALGWSTLTIAAIVTTPKPAAEPADLAGVQHWQQLSPEELAGIGFFRRENCSSCHGMGDGAPKDGPDLTRVAIRRDIKWMIEHFKHPQTMMPGSHMPPIQLSDRQLNALAAFLIKLTPQNAPAIETAPLEVLEGAIVYQSHQCGACHQANGAGRKLGPAMNGVGSRRTREWMIGHFLEPQKYSPGTVMPPYRFSQRDLDNLMSYLLSIPGEGSGEAEE